MEQTGRQWAMLNRHRWLQDDGLAARWLLAVFVLAVLLIFSRRPGDLLHAQFYAEDGLRWYAQAYNLHWLRSLLIPDASYLQVLPRLAAGAALFFPLLHAPLVMNLVGAALQALPIVALLSRRCSTWGPLPVRLGMAVVYLASPNVHEIHVNITNAQWHFGLLQILLALGLPPRTSLGRMLDVLVFALGSVSGPFDLVLLPVLLLSWWWGKRQRWPLVLAGCLLVGGVLQVVTLTGVVNLSVLAGNPPSPAHVRLDQLPLGATPTLFLRIVGDGVFLDSLVGYSKLDRTVLLVPIVFFLVGLAVTVCGLLWGPRPFRFFAVYTVLLFAAALRSPVIADPLSRWQALSTDPSMRYYFLPMLLFMWSALYALWFSRVKAVRLLCICTVCLSVAGLRQWKYQPFAEHGFASYVARFNDARTGEVVTMPIEPMPWTMTLKKH